MELPLSKGLKESRKQTVWGSGKGGPRQKHGECKGAVVGGCLPVLRSSSSGAVSGTRV